MPHFLFTELVRNLQKLDPNVPMKVLDGNTFELRIPPAVMTAKYDSFDIVEFQTEQGHPAGRLRIVTVSGGGLQFRLNDLGDPMSTDQVADYLITELAEHASALQNVLSNPR